MKYILKDEIEVESLPLGKSSVKIGEKSPDGMLEVIDRGPVPKSGTGATVICRCKCGKLTLVKLNAFRNGSIKSCGCYNIEVRKKLCKEIGKQSHYKDYTKINNIYYDFIEPIQKFNEDGSQYWKIKCKKCGKEYEEIPAFLISETRRKGNNPCDCYKFKSKGILKIKNILIKNNITFEEEKKFDTCLSPKNIPLRFDFYLPDYDCCIEYDGEQHFIEQTFGDTKESGKNKLEKTILYDNIKNNWCINNRISLIRIPYTKYKDITLNDLIKKEE